jgi:hypothetical protein
MKTKNIIFACIITLFCFTSTLSCNSCRSASTTKTVKVLDESAISSDNYSSPSLQRFVSDPENQGASVVVRDLNRNRDGVSTNPVNSRVCALIEQGLMKKNYNPRDRILFENTVAKLEDGSNYPAIHKVTGTDLIFEITQFSALEYGVNEYFDAVSRSYPFQIKKDRKEIITPTYILVGFSIEIKVILLADNLIAGIFKYNQVPCLDGCPVTNFTESSLTYINSVNGQTSFAKEISTHNIVSFDKYDRQISDFISNFVIPTMFRQMSGEKITNTEMPVSRQTSMPTSMPRQGNDDELAKIVAAAAVTTAEQQESGQRKRVADETTESPKSGQGCACEVQAEDAIQNLRPFDIQKLEKEIIKKTKKMGGIVTDSRAVALNSLCPEGWRAPTYAELLCMYRDKDKIGGFGNGGLYYSSKFNKLGSAGIDFDSGKEKTINGIRTANLRCVRCGGDELAANGSQMTVEKGIVSDEKEKEKELALSSPNSYDMAGSVSNLIFDAVKDSKKSGKYTNDEERFENMKDRSQIANYIMSITTDVANFPGENSGKTVFYCKREEGKDMVLLLFLDGKCVGVGTKNKGLLTKMPADQFTGMHTVSLWNSEKVLLTIPVDFSFKTYYPFEWNRNTLSLATISANKSDGENPVVSSSSSSSANSNEISNSISDLILQNITSQEPKKHDRYKTDEERFDNLKDKKTIMDYINSVTANVASPGKNSGVTFFCESAKGNDLNLLLFLDGKCIGTGTKSKGLLAQTPKIDGIHTLSLWCNDKKMLEMPVNFSFKAYYLFEWNRNNISLKN